MSQLFSISVVCDLEDKSFSVYCESNKVIIHLPASYAGKDIAFDSGPCIILHQGLPHHEEGNNSMKQRAKFKKRRLNKDLCPKDDDEESELHETTTILQHCDDDSDKHKQQDMTDNNDHNQSNMVITTSQQKHHIKDIEEKQSTDMVIWLDSPGHHSFIASSYPLFLKEDASVVTNVDDDSIESVSYIVTENGEVVYNLEKECIITEWADNDNEYHNAIGLPYHFLLDDDDEEGHVRIQYRWLMTNKEFLSEVQDQYNIINPTSLEDLFSRKEQDSHVSCRYVYKRVSSLSENACRKLLPDYTHVVNLLKSIYSRPTNTQFTRSLHNYLLFYYAQAKFIWQTDVGKYIYAHYLQNRLSEFGGKNQNTMLFNLLNCSYFKSVKMQSTSLNLVPKRGACSACNKKDIIQYRIILYSKFLDLYKEYTVGCNCRNRMEFFWNIGQEIHKFRDSPFECDSGNVLIEELRRMQHAFMKTENLRYNQRQMSEDELEEEEEDKPYQEEAE